jgi:hypothetical protein
MASAAGLSLRHVQTIFHHTARLALGLTSISVVMAAVEPGDGLSLLPDRRAEVSESLN